ncbi:MAG: HEPN domain-containing protein [Candidatus Omnitrophica bacterium]|nr:HEPN domain-containing protein [Candidatus Omnitrophota bacterium]MBU0896310.1 HEPN domain-containing protein [Candidatus Omnitrophota bacterium]MBU1810592.1 HEPN domain-containing protein [Candidatus Omnitrophota bacterium]
MEEITKKWLKRARYDLDTAEAMFTTCRYLYVAFMCQQSLEKIIKAIIIEMGGEALRIHNLVRLAELAAVYDLMPGEYQNFLADLTPFAIESRYGDYKRRLSEIINEKMATTYLERSKEIFKWLRRRIKK